MSMTTNGGIGIVETTIGTMIGITNKVINRKVLTLTGGIKDQTPKITPITMGGLAVLVILLETTLTTATKEIGIVTLKEDRVTKVIMVLTTIGNHLTMRNKDGAVILIMITSLTKVLLLSLTVAQSMERVVGRVMMKMKVMMMITNIVHGATTARGTTPR